MDREKIVKINITLETTSCDEVNSASLSLSLSLCVYVCMCVCVCVCVCVCTYGRYTTVVVLVTFS